MEPIKILIADDHHMVRAGLRTFLELEDDFTIVAEASDGKDAIEQADLEKPDIILMDLLMEGVNGIDATKELSPKGFKVIVLTSFLDDDMLFPVLDAGAFSYLLKTSSADDIAEAIRRAYRGEPTFQGKVTQKMYQRFMDRPKHQLLTKRELEVLALIGKGKTNQEIGETLFIGVKTVKTHVSHILAKLEVSDRTQAAIYANKHQLTAAE
ncbi:response regulator transcription factor [Salisediminibacterium beveridgei]|uniref:LuxR family transcriptional regulator, LiaR/VraR n=1 Tax=Salisediminibacterium beveridgei TaxID=632773 RepID=A0A1D7QZE8_9BACI|nr:response regulator transcription factor [Salisediminibacterium beveridgei]AOM84375.1 LuxR family transcriptional regulator, LiaR/VraR [Salisediminibacterium beveridgei]